MRLSCNLFPFDPRSLLNLIRNKIRSGSANNLRRDAKIIRKFYDLLGTVSCSTEASGINSFISNLERIFGEVRGFTLPTGCNIEVSRFNSGVSDLELRTFGKNPCR